MATTRSHAAGVKDARPRFVAGDRVPEHSLDGISGEAVRIPDPNGTVHLQFRRFAGCPYCNLHLRSIATRYDEIRAACVREVIVFHSSAADLVSYNEELPFPVIADPDKALYHEFGVEAKARALLNPRAWLPAIHGAATKRRPHSGDHRSGHLGLPADFLIASDGTVLASKYGRHAFDQWTVDELLALASEH
ncbi:MAG: peroxiredoxin-like family protein [Solirubrobacteraceae bacterium]